MGFAAHEEIPGGDKLAIFLGDRARQRQDDIGSRAVSCHICSVDSMASLRTRITRHAPSHRRTRNPAAAHLVGHLAARPWRRRQRLRAHRAGAGAPAGPAIRFVFPHAPVRPVTVNNGAPMRAWYDIKGLAIPLACRTRGMARRSRKLETLIDRRWRPAFRRSASCWPGSRRVGRWSCPRYCATADRSVA